MNNEQMDALFRKVFGDVESGDEQKLGSLNGEIVDREETILMNLKMELSNLGEVPECQLSSDRLRDAILSKGTMREPVSIFAHWWKFAVPIAACAALAVVVLQMPKVGVSSSSASGDVIASKVEVPTGSLNEKASPSDVDTLSGQEPEVENSLKEGSRAEPSPQVDSASQVKNSKRNPTRKSRPQYASRVTETVRPGLSGTSASDIATMAAADLAKPRSSSVVSGLAAEALGGFAKRSESPAARGGIGEVSTNDSASKVVIVTAGTDPNTRASNATEVDKKNVVFGG